MTNGTRLSVEPAPADASLEAWDQLMQVFENLPTAEAKRGFIDYAQAVVGFNKLRGYLTGVQTENPSSPLHGVLAAMKLDEERLWVHSKSGKDELATSLFLLFQGLSCDAERAAFVQFADAVIGYHIAKNELGSVDWQRWSM